MKANWKALETVAEYEIALKRTIEIFNAEAGTPEGEELDILLSLIIAYEGIHCPIPLPEKR